MHRISLLPVLLALIVSANLRAENWANWRGPNYDGSSTEKNLPETITLDSNLAWKSPVPGRSGATPIIWGDKVFITSADDNSKELVAICYDRRTGQQVWRNKVGEGDYAPNGGKNNMASPSPVTDGELVYFMFGTGDLACFDMSGKQVWNKSITKEYGPFTILWGYASSPLLYNGKLYITVLRRNKPVGRGGPKGSEGDAGNKPLDSFILALNPKNGQELWRHVRPNDAVAETLESFATPAPTVVDGKAQLILPCGSYMTAHDAETGEEIWRFGSYTIPKDAGDRRMVVSAVVGAGNAYITAAKKKTPIFAVKLGQKGKLSTSQAAWTLDEFQPDCCTPLFYNNALFVLDGDKNTLLKVNPKTGEKIFTGALPKGQGPFRASPTGADGKIYLLRGNGDLYVVDAGDQYKLLSSLSLNEGNDNIGCFGSVAVSQGNVFVRTPKNLYCFKK